MRRFGRQKASADFGEEARDADVGRVDVHEVNLDDRDDEEIGVFPCEGVAEECGRRVDEADDRDSYDSFDARGYRWDL